MSYENTPPLTLASALDLKQKFHDLQSDFQILSHQFGQEQRFKDFINEGHIRKHEWVNIEELLYKLSARAKKRVPTGRNPTQAELQDFVNAYGRFDYLKSEFTRIRKQLEGRYFPYQPEDVHYLVIGNQDPRPVDIHTARARSAGNPRLKPTSYSTVSGPPPVSILSWYGVWCFANVSQQFSDVKRGKNRPVMPPGDPFDDDDDENSQVQYQRELKLKHSEDTSSRVDSFPTTTNSNTRPQPGKNTRTKSRLVTSDAVTSPGTAATIANHATHGEYLPNEIEAGLHLMSKRQHLNVIRKLQDEIDQRNEAIERMSDQIAEAEATKNRMRHRQNELIERVKELTDALGLQPVAYAGE